MHNSSKLLVDEICSISIRVEKISFICSELYYVFNTIFDIITKYDDPTNHVKFGTLMQNQRLDQSFRFDHRFVHYKGNDKLNQYPTYDKIEIYDEVKNLTAPMNELHDQFIKVLTNLNGFNSVTITKSFYITIRDQLIDTCSKVEELWNSVWNKYNIGLPNHPEFHKVYKVDKDY